VYYLTTNTSCLSTAKFDKLAELEGPIGQTADGKGRYEDSQAWFDLAHKDTENTHYRNFVSRIPTDHLRCMGSLQMIMYIVR
jgi:hypothetical protein